MSEALGGSLTVQADLGRLLPVHQEQGELWVDARTLHAALQVGRDFSNWVRGRLEEVGAHENTEYLVLDGSPDLAKTSGGRQRRDYWLSLDLAKEIAMLERSEIGKQIRRYFIQAEKALRKRALALPNFGDPVEAARAWADAMEGKRNAELASQKAQQKILALEPQAQQFQTLMSADGTYSVADAAKILGTGEIRLFTLLRDQRVLMDKHRSGPEHHNVPYQPFIDRGYFKVITRPRENSERISYTTRITPKGLAWIQKTYFPERLLLSQPSTQGMNE